MRLSEVHDDDVLTPKEVGKIVRRSASFIRKKILKGELPAHKVGPKSLLIKGKAVREWVVKERVTPKPTNSAGSDAPPQNSPTGNIVSTSLTMVDRAVESVLR
jgi:excisionase family DNA binding protein